LGVALVALMAIAGCSGNDTDSTEAAGGTSSSLVGASAEEQFPAIVGVDPAFDDGSGTWSFDVTVSSPYDTPERYADGWRVLGPDGAVYGVHTLGHDHANEQPFTRRQSGVEIPADVDEVTVQGRDQMNGFGGTTFTVDLVSDS
jgi:hypothetical protein